MPIFTVVLICPDDSTKHLHTFTRAISASDPGPAIQIAKRMAMESRDGIGEVMRKNPERSGNCRALVFEGEYTMLPEPEWAEPEPDPDEGHEDWREIEAAHGVYDPEAWQRDVEHAGSKPGELTAEVEGFTLRVGDRVVVRCHDTGKVVTVTVAVIDPEGTHFGDALVMQDGRAVSLKDRGTIIAVHGRE